MYQSAVAQIFSDVPLCTHQNAVAIKRPFDCDLAVVRSEVASDPYNLGFLRRAPPRYQPPDAVAIVALTDADAIVLHEIPRMPGKRMINEVSRCGTEQAPVRCYQPGNDARVRRLAETHAYIEGIVAKGRRIDR